MVLKHPVIVILATILLVAVVASGARHLVFKSDYRVFFGKETPS